MTTLYIAGPMTGIEHFNYPAFHAAATELRAAGYTVLNPAEHPKPCENPTWEDWMKEALGAVMAADRIATLPGWETSKGARVEVAVAKELGKARRSVDFWITEADTFVNAPKELL